MDRDFPGFKSGSIEWSGDHRFHAERGDRMRIFGLHRFSGFYWLIWKAITGAHEVADELRIQNFDFSQPFARRGANPTGNQSAGRKSMMLGQGRSVHVRGDQRVGVERFFDRNAANERRNFARNLIESSEHDVLASRLHSGLLQNVAQARSGKPCRADRAFAPLNSRNLRTVKAASVARAFERVDDGMRFEFREIGKLEGKSFLDFSADCEAPAVRSSSLGSCM